MTYSKIFKSDNSDLEVEVIDRWIVLKQEDTNISLGKPENARIEIVENAIKFAREQRRKNE